MGLPPEGLASPPLAPARRLAHLDALRGVAVGLVLCQHVGERTSPALAGFSPGYLQLGQCGVLLFFACSGFIIPVSLERAGSLRVFWVNRVFRLYPLYWLSLGGAALLAVLGVYEAPPGDSPVAWLANVAMLQAFVGQPDALLLYWSLAWELAFYAGMSVLFLMGLNRRSVALSVVCDVVVVIALAVCTVTGHRAALPVGVVAFPVMFLGAVVHRWVTGEVSRRAASLAAAGTVVTLAAVAVGCLEPGSTPSGTTSVRPMLTAWWVAVALFLLGVTVGPAVRRLLEPLRRLGLISYSVYLLQALVLAAVAPPRAWPAAVVALTLVAATVVVSMVTYRWLEAPLIDVGHRHARRLAAALREACTVAPAAEPAPAGPGERATAIG